MATKSKPVQPKPERLLMQSEWEQQQYVQQLADAERQQAALTRETERLARSDY